MMAPFACVSTAHINTSVCRAGRGLKLNDEVTVSAGPRRGRHGAQPRRYTVVDIAAGELMDFSTLAEGRRFSGPRI